MNVSTAKVTEHPHLKRFNQLIKKYPNCEPCIKDLDKCLEGKSYAFDLTCYLIEEFISNNTLCSCKILNAVKQILEEDDRDAVNAIKKIARALYDNKINIFVSYKLKDEDIATEVVDAIKGVSKRFNVTYAKDFPTGKDYREKIKRATRSAHWFILLLPDPAEGWDWCLYESGLFRATKFPLDRLIVIHHKDNKVPEQISNFNAVSAEKEKLIDMLHELIREPNPIPGMDAINPNYLFIEQIAQKIAQKISPPAALQMYHFHDFVELKVEDDNPLTSDDDIDKAQIVDWGPGRVKFFGKTDMPDTWGELISNVIGKKDDSWRTELREAILSARSKNIPNELYTTIPGTYGGKYRIILNGKRQTAYGKILSYIITFLEDIRAVDRDNIPDAIGILASALKLSFRFQFEVLENESYYKLTRNSDETEELSNMIKRIMKEGETAGLLNRDLLKEQFENNSEKELIDSMYDQWFMIVDNEGKGQLNDAMSKDDVEETIKLLRELSKINKKFLKMASRRFSEMLS